MRAKEGLPVSTTRRHFRQVLVWRYSRCCTYMEALVLCSLFIADNFITMECKCNLDWSFENEADRIALEALYPSNDWRKNTGKPYSSGRVAADRIKYPANSMITTINTNNYPQKQIAKEVETKSETVEK